MEGVSFHAAALTENSYARAPVEPFGLAYLLRRGSLVLEVDSTPKSEYELKAGDIVSISGLIPHRFRSPGATAGKRPSNLDVRPFGRDEATRPVELIVGKVPNESLLIAGVYSGALVITESDYPAINAQIWSAFGIVEGELTRHDPVGWTEHAVRQASEMMLLNMLRAGIEHAVQGRNNVRAFLDMRLLRVLMTIGGDPFHDWTVAELGRVAGMSRTAFAVHFRKVLKTSPLQLLTLLRLRAASAELANSVHSIDEVANKCGYGSAAAFIRAFRRNFGTTPARWRSQHQRLF